MAQGQCFRIVCRWRTWETPTCSSWRLQPLSHEYSARVALVKTPEQCLDVALAGVAGGAETRIYCLFSYAWGGAQVKTLNAVNFARCIDLLFDFTLVLAREMVESDWLYSKGYPGHRVVELDRDSEPARDGLIQICSDYTILLAVEQDAQGNRDVQSILSSIAWVRNKLIRLTFAAIDLDLRDGVEPACSQRLLRGQHIKFPDEKVSEDTQECIRDQCRTKRHKSLTGRRVQRASNYADQHRILASREMNSVAAPSKTLQRYHGL